MLRKFGIIAVLSLLAVAFAAVPALAVTTVNFDNAPSGAHFARGASAPVCTVNETTNTVSCTGTAIEGVGNTNAVSDLDVTASATVLCHNPGNDNIVEPHTTTASGSDTEVLTPSRNGRILVNPTDVTLTAAQIESEFTCPNPNWRDEVTDITITSFTYTLTFAGFTEPAITVTGP